MAKRGRPQLPDGERVKMRSVRLANRHYEMYKQLGRDRWLRQKLEEAYDALRANTNG